MFTVLLCCFLLSHSGAIVTQSFEVKKTNCKIEDRHLICLTQTAVASDELCNVFLHKAVDSVPQNLHCTCIRKEQPV